LNKLYINRLIAFAVGLQYFFEEIITPAHAFLPQRAPVDSRLNASSPLASHTKWCRQGE
jgi:hypothetical protein